jgi:hypothetical protein
MIGRTLASVLLLCGGLFAADENIEKTIRGLYVSSQAAAREARTMEDVARALSTFAPEWVGNMPAGETLTFADLLKEGQAGIAIPPEKRPLPQLDFIYIRQTGWNVLAVYWSSAARAGNSSAHFVATHGCRPRRAGSASGRRSSFRTGH